MTTDIFLGTGIDLRGVIALLAGTLIVVIFEYRHVRQRGVRFRITLTLLRSLALLLILSALLKPLRVHSVTEDRETTLLVLTDVSESMGLPSRPGGEPRLEWVRNVLFPEGKLLDRLAETFRPRVYAFSSSARRLYDESELRPEGSTTDLAAALEQATGDMAGTALGGVLLISDGAHNTGANPLRPAYQLRGREIPVHTLAVGGDTDHRDLRVVQVIAPEQVQSGSAVQILIDVGAQGYEVADAQLQVWAEGERILTERPIRLEGDGTQRVRMTFAAGAPGITRHTVEIPPLEDEILSANNRRTFILDVVPREELVVLFLEGRPRPEFAYIKRALERDEEILVEADIALNRDSEYRIRLPGSPEESSVLHYDIIILGDVEAERLLRSGDEELSRFVGDRGGRLLVLGGASLLAAGSALRDLLPVGLSPSPDLVNGSYHPVPGKEGGIHHPILNQLAPELWDELPDLAGYAPVGDAKPAATVLLEDEESGRVLMASHRYGAGKVVLFAPYASWRWRAQAPSTSLDYEQFWIGAVRWLVSRFQPVSLELEKFTYDVGTPVPVAARVVDSSYQPRSNARVTAAIRPLNGEVDDVEMLVLEPSLAEPGRYDGSWDGAAEGEYQVDVWAHADGERLGDASGFLEVRASHIELEGRLADRPLLKRLAAAGGGLFFEPDEVETIPDRLPILSPTVTTQVEEDLWDTPHMFLGILLLLSGEWFLRRRSGLTLLAALVPSVLLSTGPAGAADGDGDELRVAYVEHETKGGWGKEWQYYGGGNMRRFLRQLQSVTDIRVSVRPESVSLHDKDLEHLFEYPILFMTSNHPADLSLEEIGNLREYLLRGGFILADDCVQQGTFTGSGPPGFTRGLIEVMAEVFPDRSFEVISNEHPVYHCVYDYPDGLPRMHPDGRWDGLGLFDDDRLMVMLSPNDICCSWQFNWGQLSTDAYQMAINIFVYALTH